MEICYYWIDKFGKGIKELGYDFGSQLTFNYEYEKKQLSIEENDLYVEDFFSINREKKIKNVTAIVGKNGVGKSTSLTAIKRLLMDQGILASRWNNSVIYYNKLLLVFKVDGEYKVFFHKDLIANKSNLIREADKLKHRYKIDFIGYGDDSSNKKLEQVKDHLYRVKDTKDFSNISCVYFSNTFDTNLYRELTIKEKNYFDISTKGILFDIDTKMKFNSTLSNLDEPNHLTNKDKRFNIGVLNEFYITELRRKINLLTDTKSRYIIERHGFLPESVSLNLDYIIHRQNSFHDIDINHSELLRIEKYRNNYNKIERYIFEKIENLPVNDDKLSLCKQTYLVRVMDAYFDDVDRLITIRKDELKKLIDDIDDKELKKKNLLDLIKFFYKVAIQSLKNIHIPGISFNEDEFKELTRSYIKFIEYFIERVLPETSLIKLKSESIKLLNTQEDGSRTPSSSKKEIIEIPLTSSGLVFLKEFIKQYEAINTNSDFIKVQWEGISSGEDTLLGIYSRFFELKKENINKNVVILLDEIEHSLHPEWQRRLIHNLIEYLPYVFSNSESIQIILATNVPFLIADIPTKNIIYLDKDEGEEGTVNKQGVFSQTFAANIHNLLIHNFFMDSTIGEFSAQKIKEVIKILDSKSNEGHNDSPEDIRRIIQTIGEPIIRNKLQSMYSNRFNEDIREAELNKLIDNFKENGDYSEEKTKFLLDQISVKFGKKDKN
ncbi:AAA family ATPase [Priestia filamentosa]|uniref:AAA family ATPase n=1 Tax=Priestia filamentosa TaxID=1402861 RepID=UPI0039819F3B